MGMKKSVSMAILFIIAVIFINVISNTMSGTVSTLMTVVGIVIIYKGIDEFFNL